MRTARKGIQTGALVKMGLLMKKTRKAYTGGAIGQDIWWHSERTLHRIYDQIRHILRESATVHEGTCEAIRLLVGSNGLEIIAQHEGFVV